MTNSTATETLTTSARFAKAIQDAMNAGVQVHENFVGDYDCQCCANIDEYLEDPLGPTVWNSVYGNNNGYEWENDVVYAFTLVEPEDDDYDDEEDEGYDFGYAIEPFRDYAYKVDKVSFNHANGGAELFAKAFKDNGFTVDWNGKDFQQLTINLY